MQGIRGAWAGGQDGMEITNHVLRQVNVREDPISKFVSNFNIFRFSFLRWEYFTLSL
jgi:hypothetical protein